MELHQLPVPVFLVEEEGLPDGALFAIGQPHSAPVGGPAHAAFGKGVQIPCLDLPRAAPLQLRLERFDNRDVACPLFAWVRADGQNATLTGEEALNDAHISRSHALVLAKYGISAFG
jgi:hypothetical protein